MATINEKVAIAAYQEGWLFSDLSENQRLILHPQVVTMNTLCRIVLRNPEITMAEAARIAELNANTAYIYLRWLYNYGILTNDLPLQRKQKLQPQSVAQADQQTES